MRSHDPLLIRLLTHNVRYATDSPFVGEEKWEVRAPRLIAELSFNTTHCPESFIGLQEVLHGQLVHILKGLNREREGEWDYVGVGRDDGVSAGEYSPILYRPSVWTLQSWDTTWLSETPSKPSRGWDAACRRILTTGIFRHNHSKKKLVAMSTHLDHQGPISRLEAAKIILGQIEEKSQHGHLPAFLAGDFNSQPEDDAYRMLTGEASPMRDLHTMASPEKRYGHYYTFTGFGHDKPTRIDFLFANGKTYPWLSHGYAVLENRFDDAVYSSDHRAVVADVAIP
ncbi:MAG: hypothetical protein Q9193_000316 [Seirophora villosa]